VLYEILNIIFTLVVVGGLLWAYVAYISEKGDDLKVKSYRERCLSKVQPVYHRA